MRILSIIRTWLVLAAIALAPLQSVYAQATTQADAVAWRHYWSQEFFPNEIAAVADQGAIQCAGAIGPGGWDSCTTGAITIDPPDPYNIDQKLGRIVISQCIADRQPQCMVYTWIVYIYKAFIPIEECRCAAVGNPTLPGSGRKLHEETDYFAGGSAALNIRRYYRSIWTDGAASAGMTSLSGYAAGWKISTHASLTRLSDNSIRAFRADGSTVAFDSSSSTLNTWIARSGSDVITAIVNAAGQLTGYTYSASVDNSTETYAAIGQLQSIRQRNGDTTTLSYNATGQLTGVRNPFGREVKFSYDAQGRMTELLPPGAVAGTAAGSGTSPIRYAYAESASLGSGVAAKSQLTSVTWQDGRTKRYHYEDSRFPGALTGITDEAGVRYATYSYDDQGRVNRTEHVGGADRVDFAYSFDGNGPTTTVTHYTGPSGSATTRTYTFVNQRGVLRPMAVTAPCSLCGNTQQSTTYDTTGNPTKTIAHDGTVTFYAYDAKGRETERATFPSTYQSATARPALTAATSVTSNQWHATWNLPIQTAEPGKITAYTYDSKGNLTGQSWTATTDTAGRLKFSPVKTGSTYATGWSYNANSLATTIVERETPAGATTAAETGRWTLAYNALGDVTSVKDEKTAKSATLTVNNLGLTTKLVASNGVTANFTPDSRGRMVKATTPGFNVDFTIDSRGLTNEIRFSDGRWLRYTYSAAQRLIQVTDNTGKVEKYAGVDPKWFLDENTVRTAAAWLYLQGDRLSNLLIPKAHAQSAAVLVPAGIVLVLYLIADTQRRNGQQGVPGRPCCGQDGPPDSNSGADGARPSWLRQIAILLSGQSQPDTTTAPVYDKAGLLVSPIACKNPPGDCDPGKWQQLQDDVNQKCKSSAMRCTGGMAKADLLLNLQSNRACAVARDKINKTCFAGGDINHRNSAIDAWRAVTNCETLFQRLP